MNCNGETITLCSKYLIKGIVRVISSDPPYKDGNARFIMVPKQALSD